VVRHRFEARLDRQIADATLVGAVDESMHARPGC
jgi:hypothetical protein